MLQCVVAKATAGRRQLRISSPVTVRNTIKYTTTWVVTWRLCRCREKVMCIQWEPNAWRVFERCLRIELAKMALFGELAMPYVGTAGVCSLLLFCEEERDLRLGYEINLSQT